MIEPVQKTALHIILGDQNTTYTVALNESKLITLADRKEKLISKFSLRTLDNPKFATWFVNSDPKVIQTRSVTGTIKEVPSKTKRYENSTIPVITVFHFLFYF